MIGTLSLRQANAGDAPAIRDLTNRAFGRDNEARAIDQLEADRSDYLQIVALNDGRIVGHILFYHVGVRGKLGAIGLGPMSVDPAVQRQGVGQAMIQHGLTTCRDAGVPIVFVLGHPEYYSKTGFSVEAVSGFTSPWSDNPAFMAIRLRHGPPMSGDLVFPKAFGV